MKYLALLMIFGSSLNGATALYFCNSTDIYGLAFGDGDVKREAKRRCKENGGRRARRIIYYTGRGYGAIAIGYKNRRVVIGIATGHPTKRAAMEHAKLECRKRNACSIRVTKTFHDKKEN